jgi:carboxymethylenebutenolidase
VPVVGESVSFGDLRAYLARPQHASRALPAVLVIHDSLGLDEHTEDLSRRLAAAGYVALAPDLYAQDGERPIVVMQGRIDEAIAFLAAQPPAVVADQAARQAALAALPSPQGARIAETLARIFAFGAPEQRERHLRALGRWLHYLREARPETRGQRVASLGEGLSAQLACEEPDLAGAVVFYGLTPPLERLARIRCPVIAFYGSEDVAINRGIATFVQAMQQAGLEFEHHLYEGARHGFFNDMRPAVYDVQASRDAFARLLAFLARTL